MLDERFKFRPRKYGSGRGIRKITIAKICEICSLPKIKPASKLNRKCFDFSKLVSLTLALNIVCNRLAAIVNKPLFQTPWIDNVQSNSNYFQ